MRLTFTASAVCLIFGVLTPAAFASDSQFTARYVASWVAYVPGLGYSSSNYQDAQTVHSGAAFRQFGTSEATSGSRGSWDALAVAGPGLVRLSASGSSHSTIYGETGSMNAEADAVIDDFFTPMSSNPADLGKAVTITGSFVVSGSLSASESGDIDTSLFDNQNIAVGATSLSASGTGMELSPYGDNTFGRVNRQTGQTPVDEALVRSIQVTLTGHIGDEIEMRDTFILGGVAQSANNLLPAPNEAAGTFDAELQHTIAWGGVSSAVDDAGHAFAGFTMVSANTGVDYAQPVPEPTTCLALGLGAFGGLRSRRSGRADGARVRDSAA